MDPEFITKISYIFLFIVVGIIIFIISRLSRQRDHAKKEAKEKEDKVRNVDDKLKVIEEKLETALRSTGESLQAGMNINDLKQSKTTRRVCAHCEKIFETQDKTCPFDGDLLIVLSEETLSPGYRIDNRFVIKELIGKGGMGAVYRAFQLSVERDIALKVMRKGFSENVTNVKRFLLEAKNASKLTHQNTITIFDFGQSDEGFLYIAMEYLKGKSLSQVIEEEKTLDPERVVRIMCQICDSLYEAHQLKIIHRDLKPENILLINRHDNSDFVKVLDFGISKMLTDKTKLTLSSIGGMGTPAYMSPKQILGKEIDQRTDIYSLGVIMYECLSGTGPFAAETTGDLLYKHINDRPLPVTMMKPGLKVSGQLEAIMMSALEKSPGKRPQSTMELKSMLMSI
jgi:serine/threonine-protein kinase